MTYYYYPNAICNGYYVNPQVNVAGDGSVPDAPSYQYNSASTAYWVAVYSGDANYASASSGCADEPLLVLSNQATPTISTNLSADSIALGETAYDTAELIGAAGTPTGTVHWFEYSFDNCTGLIYDQVKPLNGDGTLPDFGPFTFSYAGTYYFVATYSGNNVNTGISSACDDEPFTVNAAEPTISTTLSTDHVYVGETAHDSATLSGAFNPTGTVTYVTYNSLAECESQSNANSTGSPKVLNGAPGYTLPDSDTVTFSYPVPATQYWVATYSGDNNNVGRFPADAKRSRLPSRTSPRSLSRR